MHCEHITIIQYTGKFILHLLELQPCCESLSPWDSMCSSCGWRRWPPDMEGSCKYIEKAVMDGQQGVVLQHEEWVRS